VEITKELKILTDTCSYLSNNITNYIYTSSDEYGICKKKGHICEKPLRTQGKAFLLYI